MIIYILIGVAILLFVAMLIFSATAYKRFIKAYQKYSQYNTYVNVVGVKFATLMIKNLDLKTKIFITDHELADSYLPTKNSIVLSKQVAHNSSIASIAIVAHELGHAVQHKHKNFMFLFSCFLSLVIRICRFILPIMIAIGFVFLFFAEYNMIGQILLIVSASLIILSYVLKLVNIPVEFGASKIAYDFLKDKDILSADELKHAKMLNIAGQTYIASLFMGFVNFFKKIANSFKK